MNELGFHAGRAIKCGWCGEVLVVFIVQKVQDEDIEILDEALNQALAQSPSGKMAVITFVKPGTPIPMGRVRRRLINLFRKRKMEAFGLVPTLPGESLWIRLARKFVIVVLAIVRPPFKVTVSSSLNDTLGQMERILRERSPSGTRLSVEELGQLVDRVAEATGVPLSQVLSIST
jgi:hypothetical protein